MLNSSELNLFLKDGKVLLQEIETFIKKESTAVSSSELTVRIGSFVDNIKPKLSLFEPSVSENNELSLLIINLGRISRDFEAIKATLNNNVQSNPSAFFKINTPAPLLQRLTGHLNQLENSLQPSISPAPAA